MIKLAVFISGGGTTLKNLIDQRDHGQLDVDLDLMISSTAKAAGLEIAQRAGIETRVIRKSDFGDDAEAYSEAMFGPCRERRTDLVVMGGFLKHLLIPPDFDRRVINIHPSLIPAFCGPQMYGLRVHQAAVEFGVKISGCTVHYVDNQYDHGPIILQRSCPVLDDDTPKSLAERVFVQECIALPEAIRLISNLMFSVREKLTP